MNDWRCVKCGTERGGFSLRPSVSPQYRFGYCVKCGAERHFIAAPERSLDGHGHARHSDPLTSKEAADRIRTGSAKAALLLAHAQHPGMTDEEAAERAHLSLASEYATRCSELMRAGYLRDTTATRLGSSGMRRVVREITDAGRRAVGL